MAAFKHDLLLLVVVVATVVFAAAAASNDNDPTPSMEESSRYHQHHGRRGGWAPPPPPPPPQPPVCSCCTLCREQPRAGPVVEPAPPLTTDCVTAPCVGYLTGVAAQSPAPQGPCCRGLAGFMERARTEGERALACICPLLKGEVNDFLLPRHRVDPVKFLFLQGGCGVALPPEVTSVCA